MVLLFTPPAPGSYTERARLLIAERWPGEPVDGRSLVRLDPTAPLETADVAGVVLPAGPSTGHLAARYRRASIPVAQLEPDTRPIAERPESSMPVLGGAVPVPGALVATLLRCEESKLLALLPHLPSPALLRALVTAEAARDGGPRPAVYAACINCHETLIGEVPA